MRPPAALFDAMFLHPMAFLSHIKFGPDGEVVAEHVLVEPQGLPDGPRYTVSRDPDAPRKPFKRVTRVVVSDR